MRIARYNVPIRGIFPLPKIPFYPSSAAAPETISKISLVIAA